MRLRGARGHEGFCIDLGVRGDMIFRDERPPKSGMTFSSSTTPRPATEVTCTACGAQTTVPFVPTPGRPVYCRECFSKRQSGPAGRPAPRGAPRRGPSGGGIPRRRMLSQGRKGHFLFDAGEVMRRHEGGMDDQHHRAFLEGLFARGARHGTDAAKEFLDEKRDEGLVTREEHQGLMRLLDRYSQWR